MEEKNAQRYRLTIEYDGTDFVGWQVQPNGRSVQGEIEAALRRLFSTDVRVHGAGRTDAGVHAAGQVAHFDIASALDGDTMRRAINAELPPDITVHTADIVDDDFHARFSASSRSYRYLIAHDRVSIDRRSQWILYATLDHDAIRAALPALSGTHDFTTFSKLVPDMPHHFCHVFSASWEQQEGWTQFSIRANRFLHGMVRCLVGGLVQVGRKKITPAGFADMLAARDRLRAPMLAPPQGLTLTAVGYDTGEWKTVEAIMQQLRERPEGD